MSSVSDIERNREGHIVRCRADIGRASYEDSPVWCGLQLRPGRLGRLLKVIVRGAKGQLADLMASSVGVARADFASRVKARPYLRSRWAHHSRLRRHAIIDDVATPNNVRVKAKQCAGQFDSRSILDVVASLSNVLDPGIVAFQGYRNSSNNIAQTKHSGVHLSIRSHRKIIRDDTGAQRQTPPLLRGRCAWLRPASIR